jgi:hypothetical protein
MNEPALRLSRDMKSGATVNVISVVAGAAVAPATRRLCQSRSRFDAEPRHVARGYSSVAAGLRAGGE